MSWDHSRSSSFQAGQVEEAEEEPTLLVVTAEAVEVVEQAQPEEEPLRPLERLLHCLDL